MPWTKEMPAHPVVAVAGATGAVGHEFLEVLHDLDFPASEVRALASKRSAGKKLPFKGCGQVPAGELTVEEMTADSFKGVDIALFSAGASVSKEMRQAVIDAGAVMIDNSSAFRMDDDVPLVVPEVNPKDIAWHSGVIANPNCSTIQMVVALKPLYDISPIKRVVVSTYQAASGAGAKAMDELYSQTQQFLNGEELTVEAFSDQIAFNCIPHIDIFLDDASTKEEWKMVVETKKIMGDDGIQVAATCVRVPVLRCHGEAINVEFEDEVTPQQARAAFEAAPGVTVMDDIANNVYPMPGLLAGTDGAYVGRIRKDLSVPHGLAFWDVADQIRKGAALNAVQIAQLLLP
ncbi:MAG: aspartate-semialdehyde dehydrogenase [Eggerthellaceae bacterium]